MLLNYTKCVVSQFNSYFNWFFTLIWPWVPKYPSVGFLVFGRPKYRMLVYC